MAMAARTAKVGMRDMTISLAISVIWNNGGMAQRLPWRECGSALSRTNRIPQPQHGLGRCLVMPSTVIRSYSYNAHRRELDIVFQTMRRYRYRHVPVATYAAMNAAPSKGAFFNRHIRGRFEFWRDPDALPRLSLVARR